MSCRISSESWTRSCSGSWTRSYSESSTTSYSGSMSRSLSGSLTRSYSGSNSRSCSGCSTTSFSGRKSRSCSGSKPSRYALTILSPSMLRVATSSFCWWFERLIADKGERLRTCSRTFRPPIFPLESRTESHKRNNRNVKGEKAITYAHTQKCTHARTHTH